MTTKIVALVDALGNLARFILLPGQRHDSVGVDALIYDVPFGALLADKAFDNCCNQFRWAGSDDVTAPLRRGAW